MSTEHEIKLIKSTDTLDEQISIWTESELSNPIEKEASTKNPRRKFSKMGFAKASVLAIATAFGLGYATKGEFPNISFASQFRNGEQNNDNSTIVLSNKEISFQKEMIGYMSWTPDGPITYWTTAEGKKRYLLTGGKDNATYMLETDGKSTLKDIMASGSINGQSFKEVYGPDKRIEYRKHYAGITSVLQIDKSNPDHLLGIAHCEQRTSRDASADYTATIGLAESFDGGLTWQDKGPLITGTDVKAPGGQRVSGAGQPTAIYNQKDGYVYIMYVDWSATGQHPDQLYMARAKANDNGSLGQLEYYTNNGFSVDKENLKPVIPVPQDSNLVYVALPHLSWNTFLNKYMVEGESDIGFWNSTSTDLINWSRPKIIYDFTQWGGKPHSILKPGEKWDSYPTMLSEDQPNSEITDDKGVFYHSSGDNLSPHEPYTLDFNIK